MKKIIAKINFLYKKGFDKNKKNGKKCQFF